MFVFCARYGRHICSTDSGRVFSSGLIMQRHSFTALNSTFVVDSEYQFVKELGQGAYGCVVAARHRRSGEGCAIKKITNINTKVCAIRSQFSSSKLFFRGSLPRDACERSGWYPSPLPRPLSLSHDYQAPPPLPRSQERSCARIWALCSSMM
jgi:hypothetical protein